MRSIRAKHNMIAVSAGTAETAINTEQTLDLSLLAAIDNIITLSPRRETNADEATGKEEPDTVYDMGKTSALQLMFAKAQPQHFAFLYAYALGEVATTAAGDGYLHTITPIDGDLEVERSQPSFTAAQRMGKTIARERFASMFINSLSALFSKDSFCQVSGEAVGTGKYDSSITEESITAAENVTELTLAANGVSGADAAGRLDAVHQIKVELSSGVWTEVEFSAVSAATPAVITISAPGVGTDDRTFKVLYAPADEGWMTFPSRVVETPLRVSELVFTLGGTWNGSSFAGGKDIGAEINSIEHKFANNGAVEFTPGAGGSYASRYFRDGREQTLVLDREFRDYIIRNHMDENDTFGARILAEGAEFDTGHNYGVDIIFPKLGVLEAPISVNGKRLGEKGDMIVLEDDTYGSVIVKVKNLQTGYAQ